MFYAFNVENGEVIGYTTENTRFACLALSEPALCPISDSCAHEIMTAWLEANGKKLNEAKYGLEADLYAMYRYLLLIDGVKN